MKANRRIFIVTPGKETDDLLYHICSTTKKGTYFNIYQNDEYDVEESCRADDITHPMSVAKKWAERIGYKGKIGVV